MGAKTQWKELADELGFQLNPEIRPFIELPSLHKMAAQALKTGDLHNAEILLEVTVHSPNQRNSFSLYRAPPCVKVVAREAVPRWPEKIGGSERLLLEHPVIVDMLSKTFVGSATGIYRNYEFAVFRSTHTGTPAPIFS